MAYEPATPFPKGRGDTIRATDWNAAVTEVIRLEQAKLNQAGGTVAGNLTVQGNLTASGTISGPLAQGIVGSPQLANGAVTTDKIAVGAVGTNQIQGGSINAAKLFAQVTMQNLTVTLPAGVGARREVILASERLAHVCPLVFLSASAGPSNCLFDYSYRYFTETFAEDGRFVTNFRTILVLTNQSTNSADVTISCYLFRP